MKAGGAEGNRTPDLCSAIAALSHLSYSPAPQPLSVSPMGSGSGRRLPSRLFPPLQSLVPRGFRPADLGLRVIDSRGTGVTRHSLFAPVFRPAFRRSVFMPWRTIWHMTVTTRG